VPIPNSEQLALINRFTQVPRTEEDTYVFDNLMIDNGITSYSSTIHPNLLNKFMEDSRRGVGLLTNHNNRQLPVGRSFNAEMRYETNHLTGAQMQSVHGQFYIDLGRNTQSGLSTDDIAKGIDAGTIFDTSIGFNADSWDCSVCSNDIRDWRACEHFPGEKYAVVRNGVDVVETCLVIVGKDGGGELLENSLVYAGACNRATITTSNFSADGVGDVSEKENGTKLHLVEDFKNIPLSATIHQYYTKDGSVLFTNTEERTNGSQELKQRSERKMELAQMKEIFSKFGIQFETAEELSVALQSFADSQSELATVSADLETVKGELAVSGETVTELTSKVSAHEATIAELEVTNSSLVEKAGVAETYRQDLLTRTIESGVRAHGNSFNAELYTKFLSTLSIDEIKGALASFEKEVADRFAGARISTANQNASNRNTGEPTSHADFASEGEFRDFVSEKATEFAKETNVSIKVAMKEMMKKYSADGSDM
jgi:hypothetical protein